MTPPVLLYPGPLTLFMGWLATPCAFPLYTLLGAGGGATFCAPLCSALCLVSGACPFCTTCICVPYCIPAGICASTILSILAGLAGITCGGILGSLGGLCAGLPCIGPLCFGPLGGILAPCAMYIDTALSQMIGNI